jgi:hypothetical protein
MRRTAAVALVLLSLVLMSPTMALADPCSNQGGDPKCNVPESPGSGLLYPAGALAALGLYVAVRVVRGRRRISGDVGA